MIGVEPAAGDDATRSFRTRTLQTAPNPQTVADGARTPSLGTLTFPLILEYVSEMTTVVDATLLKTMFLLWERLKLVVEPTGALGAAAVLHGGFPITGTRVASFSPRQRGFSQSAVLGTDEIVLRVSSFVFSESDSRRRVGDQRPRACIGVHAQYTRYPNSIATISRVRRRMSD